MILRERIGSLKVNVELSQNRLKEIRGTPRILILWNVKILLKVEKVGSEKISRIIFTEK